MGIDRDKLEDTLMALGEALQVPTHLCLVGCTPGIFFGQPERTTQAIDVWGAQSSFELDELARACESVGLLCDPTGEVDAEAVYLRILRSGMAAFPERFELQEIETYRQLTISMPRAVTLVAAALVRANGSDVEDFVFWMGERRLKFRDVESAVGDLPPEHRDAARENLTLARLVAIDGLGS